MPMEYPVMRIPPACHGILKGWMDWAKQESMRFGLTTLVKENWETMFLGTRWRIRLLS